MPVGPEQIRVNTEKEISELVTSIDAQLKTQKMRDGVATVYCNSLKNVSLYFSDIRRIYMGVGWKDVKFRSDQRDGDSLTFYA